MKKTTIPIVIFIVILISSFVFANPISSINRSKAEEDLKNSLMATYGNSYSTVEMLLNAGMKAYDELCAVQDNAINNGILHDLVTTYYPSFSTIQMLYKSNIESYMRLNKQK
ncbi:MAG: hypothetical protein ACLQVJ_12395 [Syntrophobacteraceae bacterium]